MPAINGVTPWDGLSNKAIGTSAENLACGLAILGAEGRLRAGLPDARVGRINIMFHLRGEFDRPLGVQVFCRTAPDAPGLAMFHFLSRPERLMTSPAFWYLFAVFGPGGKSFIDPMFLVPSEVVHRRLHPARGGLVRFRRVFRLSPNSREPWSRFQVAPDDLGRKICEAIEGLPRWD